MKKKLFSDYAVFKDNALIIEIFKGVVLPGSIANMKTIQSKDPNFSYLFDLISDYRETSFDTLIVNVIGFCEFLEQNKILYGETHKNAVLISSKNQKVHVDLFIRLKSNDRVRCFYSIDKALEWLNRTNDKVFVEEKIHEMKQSPNIEWEVVSDF